MTSVLFGLLGRGAESCLLGACPQHTFPLWESLSVLGLRVPVEVGCPASSRSLASQHPSLEYLHGPERFCEPQGTQPGTCGSYKED